MIANWKRRYIEKLMFQIQTKVQQSNGIDYVTRDYEIFIQSLFKKRIERISPAANLWHRDTERFSHHPLIIRDPNYQPSLPATCRHAIFLLIIASLSVKDETVFLSTQLYEAFQ